MGHLGLKRIEGIKLQSEAIKSQLTGNSFFFHFATLLGIRPDDLFVLLDADEIPDPRVLLFLKLYDGYPEPIALYYILN